MDIFPDGVLSERPEDQAAFVDAMLREFMSRGAEPENVFCDLVSMMMHWADLRGMNVDCEVRRAYGFFREERELAD